MTAQIYGPFTEVSILEIKAWIVMTGNTPDALLEGVKGV